MAKTTEDLLKKYNQIPDLTPTDILRCCGVITKCEILTADNSIADSDLKKVISQSPDTQQLNDNNLLGDSIAEKDPTLEKITEQIKENIILDPNEHFITRDTSLNERFTKSVIKNFPNIFNIVNNAKDSYILVTQGTISYKIFIAKETIPHILGLPNAYIVTTELDSYSSNYLKKQKNNTYLESMKQMFCDNGLNWFSYQVDEDSNSKFIHKDNSDKIAYKIACFLTLIDIISIGDSNHFGNGNSLITYEYKPKGEEPRIMNIINIPKTDGYVGFICQKEKDSDNYVLSSIAAFNKEKIKKTIAFTKKTYSKINNSLNTESNVTFVKVDQANPIMTQRKKNKASEKIYPSAKFRDDNPDNPPILNALIEFAVSEIRKNNPILITNILNIINNITENKDELSKLLPKYIIYIILTSELYNENFIYNILTILKNYKNNYNINDICNILQKLYCMDNNTLQMIFPPKVNNKFPKEDDKNCSEIGFSVSGNQISINCCFKCLISNNNMVIPFNFTSTDVTEVENKFKAFISNIYDRVLYSDEIVLNLTDSDYINFSRTIQNLIRLQTSGIMFIEEIKRKSKGISK